MELYNLEFSDSEIRQAAEADRLLSLEIEFSRLCNFRCSYCYLEEKDASDEEMTRAEIRDVIRQAKALGARKVIILGGEPSIYPHLVEMLDFLADEGLGVEMFTNGSGVTPELARILAEKAVRVVVKMNSRDPEVQDLLAGRKGAYRIGEKALANLRQAGYPSRELFLAASTVICRQNIAELPSLWRWLRRQEIEPYFEVLTPQANALANQWLQVAPADLKELFEELAAIDRREFARDWRPQPPLVGNRCMRHQVSCLVNALGQVMPCVGVTIELGSIRRQPLAEILQHRVIRELKDYRRTIKGPCGECDQRNECYGCRGAAYQLTGDHLAADPTCWRNCDPVAKKD